MLKNKTTGKLVSTVRIIKTNIPKNGSPHRRQVVNPWHQPPQWEPLNPCLWFVKHCICRQTTDLVDLKFSGWTHMGLPGLLANMRTVYLLVTLFRMPTLISSNKPFASNCRLLAAVRGRGSISCMHAGTMGFPYMENIQWNYFYPVALKGSGVLSSPERAGGWAAGQTSPVNTLTSIIFHGSFSNLARTFITLRSRTSSIMEVLPHWICT